MSSMEASLLARRPAVVGYECGEVLMGRLNLILMEAGQFGPVVGYEKAWRRVRVDVM